MLLRGVFVQEPGGRHTVGVDAHQDVREAHVAERSQARKQAAGQPDSAAGHGRGQGESGSESGPRLREAAPGCAREAFCGLCGVLAVRGDWLGGLVARKRMLGSASGSGVA